MPRNSSANKDILYKCTIDEIRLMVISDLQKNYKQRMNIHKGHSMSNQNKTPLTPSNFHESWSGCRVYIDITSYKILAF